MKPIEYKPEGQRGVVWCFDCFDLPWYHIYTSSQSTWFIVGIIHSMLQIPFKFLSQFMAGGVNSLVRLYIPFPVKQKFSYSFP